MCQSDTRLASRSACVVVISVRFGKVEPGEIRFYVDDVQTCTYRHWWSCSKLVKGSGTEAKKEADLNPWPAPFDQPFYLVMNVAVGGNFPGAPNDETRFPAELVIDYVRVYDKVGGYGPPKDRGPGVMPWQKGHQSERRN